MFQCCDNKANSPSGEHFLQHNNNLLDTNLTVNVSRTNTKKYFRAETSSSTPKYLLAKLIDYTLYLISLLRRPKLGAAVEELDGAAVVVDGSMQADIFNK